MNSAHRPLATRLLLTAALLAPCAVSSSAQGVPTAYDYTNITPPNQKVSRLLENSNDTIAAAHITLLDLITLEYPYRPEDIFGLTEDQRTTRFDVAAKIDPPGVPNPEHAPLAYKFTIHALLRNHFLFVAHEAQEDVTFEQLMVIPNGPKPGPCLSRRARLAGNHPASICTSTSALAARLSHDLHIEVDDKANLPAAFAMDPNWSSDPVAFRKTPGAQPQLPQGLETALQTVGLTLVPSHKREKVLIVDSVGFPAIIYETKAATDSQ